jgi:cobalt-zinc-cadmium efflux system protein
MLIFAVIGIAVNLAAVLRLRRGASLNEKVVSWHLLEDVLGWCAVLVGSVVMMFADVPVIDPLLSVLITLFVLFNVAKNLKKIWKVFLQGVPDHVSVEDIEKAIALATGARAVYHTHVWSLDGEKHFLSTHIAVDDDITQSGIVETKQKARDAAAQMGMAHVTIQVDFAHETAARDCDL